MLILAAIGKFLFGFWTGALKAIGQVADFTIAHWRIILPLAIVGAMSWLIYSRTAERDEARAQLLTLQTEIKSAQDQRRVENTLKLGMTAAAISIITAGHETETNNLRRQYEAELKTQKGATAAAKSDTDHVADNWRTSLRDKVAGQAAATGLPGVPETASGSAASGGSGDAACARQEEYIDTLEIACAITTSDYNALYKAWDAQCENYGCR